MLPLPSDCDERVLQLSGSDNRAFCLSLTAGVCLPPSPLGFEVCPWISCPGALWRAGGRFHQISPFHLLVPLSGWVRPGLEVYRTPRDWGLGGYGSRKLRVLEACGWAAGARLAEEPSGGGRKSGWDVGARSQVVATTARGAETVSGQPG